MAAHKKLNSRLQNGSPQTGTMSTSYVFTGWRTTGLSQTHLQLHCPTWVVEVVVEVVVVKEEISEINGLSLAPLLPLLARSLSTHFEKSALQQSPERNRSQPDPAVHSSVGLKDDHRHFELGPCQPPALLLTRFHISK
ncbi:hypothetical protein EYF80_024323 [Liparis tanakae]|uniref:Uncharacterized protein n=1 Tax=Liparis tanakae TaxID=230148 RepID=A0A4Z2HKP7_9TELE|nr:hypothetical protein EYF80_024323 [Liparis tanakae]